jgi:hypothetical protein
MRSRHPILVETGGNRPDRGPIRTFRHDAVHHLVREETGTPEPLASRLRLSQTLPGAFPDTLALELGDGGQDVGHETAGRLGRVDIEVEEDESPTFPLGSFQEPSQLYNGSRQPVELGGHQGVVAAL